MGREGEGGLGDVGLPCWREGETEARGGGGMAP